ncbi:hypothetical protein CK203_102657 [Vitis vinifera]|uniref:Uncharacterized protein n=1 Tax=Vitis vinifera TaxID=29760 RepID=A0A438C5X5_VITVI|nr:hypothetical protein CK203_102657 [Vitis vinifera]
MYHIRKSAVAAIPSGCLISGIQEPDGRGGRFNFSGYTYPNPLIALTPESFAAILQSVAVINFVDYSRNQGAPARHESAETPSGHESNGAVARNKSNGAVAEPCDQNWERINSSATWDDLEGMLVASLSTKFRMPEIERYAGIGCPRIHLRFYSTVMRAHGLDESQMITLFPLSLSGVIRSQLVSQLIHVQLVLFD